MCGICGILDPQHRLGPVAAMNRAQRHRGPDDEGYLFVDGASGRWQMAGGPATPTALGIPDVDAVDSAPFDLVLGSRRLAILDLSPAGHMPMAYADGRFWLTYNGEIYNYKELRRTLMDLGHSFASGTDTEVILAAYAEWGPDCLSRFNGMFAFALWDSPRRRLFCARDRFGIKPFYYHWNGASFVFASELKSLLQHPLVPRQPDDRTVYDYLALGLSDHTSATFYAGIQALEPAHFLLVDPVEGRLEQRRWWQAQINDSMAQPSPRAMAETTAEFGALLEDAVRLRLRADVPLGSALSGGLDSSAVVTLVNRLLRAEADVPAHLLGERQKTFTARNREREIDEYGYSRRIVEQTGAAEHTTVPEPGQLWSELEDFVWSLDEPVNSTSQYAQWCVMRLARAGGVTVLLDGQGGDEILAGYYAYYPPYVRQVHRQRGRLAALRAAYDVSRIGGAPVRNILFEQTKHRLPWRLQQLLSLLRPERLAPGQGGTGLQAWQMSEKFMQRFHDRRWQPAGAEENGLVGVLYQDLTATNLPKLLRYEDRNSMAFSLETRLPFLDVRLVEMVFGLPLTYRIQGGWSKWILRQAMADVLPREICWRRSKLGFPTPEIDWLREGSPTIRRVLTKHADDDRVHRYVRPDAIRRMLAASDAELAATPGLWRMVNLMVWLDQMPVASSQPPVNNRGRTLVGERDSGGKPVGA